MEKQIIIDKIRTIVEREEPVLRSLPEDVITGRLNGQGRSIKMLVGHLIDSAANNHQRMVRLHIGQIHELMVDVNALRQEHGRGK
ncbi:MAG: hypothetical protein ACI3ZP_00125 [Candidatus Cryptobacteroides sp.]